MYEAAIRPPPQPLWRWTKFIARLCFYIVAPVLYLIIHERGGGRFASSAPVIHHSARTCSCRPSCNARSLHNLVLQLRMSAVLAEPMRATQRCQPSVDSRPDAETNSALQPERLSWPSQVHALVRAAVACAHAAAAAGRRLRAGHYTARHTSRGCQPGLAAAHVGRQAPLFAAAVAAVARRSHSQARSFIARTAD